MQARRVHELFEVRRLIELPMIELAAARATEEERRAITELAAQFHDDLELEEFSAMDRAFHWGLARLAHNQLLAEVYGKVLDALFDSEDWDRLLSESLSPQAVRGIITAAGREHRRIATAVKRGEEVTALEAISAHLTTVENRIIAQLVT
jgi:GntR family transcriptional repressor for pyruvate dehydrogenase complex